MKIEAVDARRMRITLSMQDMQALGLTYQALLLGEDRINGALRSLLQAGEQAGFCCRAEKLLIEVYPLWEEGCILYFTGLRRPVRYRIRERVIWPRLFLFQNADDLCSACRAVCQRMSQRVVHSSLYRLKEGRYILAVCPADGPRSPLLCLLREFGEYMGKGQLLEAVIREHAVLLREGDAVHAFSRPLI